MVLNSNSDGAHVEVKTEIGISITLRVTHFGSERGESEASEMGNSRPFVSKTIQEARADAHVETCNSNVFCTGFVRSRSKSNAEVTKQGSLVANVKTITKESTQSKIRLILTF